MVFGFFSIWVVMGERDFAHVGRQSYWEKDQESMENDTSLFASGGMNTEK